MTTSMTPRAISDRLRAAAASSDLRSARRLLAKVPMRASDVSRRLRQAAALRDLCLRLGRLRPR